MFGRTGNAKSNVTQASAWVTYLLLVIGIVSPVVCVIWLVRTAVENENAVVQQLVAEAIERRMSDAESLVHRLTTELVPSIDNKGAVYSWASPGETVSNEEKEQAKAMLSELRSNLEGLAELPAQDVVAEKLESSEYRALRLGNGRMLGALIIQLGLRRSAGDDSFTERFRMAADAYVIEEMSAGGLSRQHRYLLRQYAPLSESTLVGELLAREAMVDQWLGAAESLETFPPAEGVGSVGEFVYFRDDDDAENVSIFRRSDWLQAIEQSTDWKSFGLALVWSENYEGDGRVLEGPFDFVAMESLQESQSSAALTSDKAVLYLWIGGIVLGLSVLSGVAIVMSVRRQASVTQLKDNLVATVTHELKTPVSSIRLLVDTLMDEGRREKVNTQEYIELISRENQRLGRLIDNFLSFSRMERSKGSFDIKRISPVSVVDAAEQAFRERFKGQRFDLEIRLDEKLPDIVGDQDALATVLGNLLENAFKYGGRDRRIELHGTAGVGGLEFEVQDFGKGISKRDQKRVFRKFFQVDHNASGQTGSVGLGLSIVEFIVSKHSGHIELDSEIGKGSTFRVRIPYA